jgi:hypothetical protein
LACHLDIDADPDPAHHFDADAYTDPACLLFIVYCLLFIYADPDPVYHFAAKPDADPDSTFQIDADPSGSGSTTLRQYYKRRKFVESTLDQLSPGCACLVGDHHRR